MRRSRDLAVRLRREFIEDPVISLFSKTHSPLYCCVILLDRCMVVAILIFIIRKRNERTEKIKNFVASK